MKKHNVDNSKPHVLHRYSLSLALPAKPYPDLVRAMANRLFGLAVLLLLSLTQWNLAQGPIPAQPRMASDQVNTASRKKQKNIFSSDVRDFLTRNLEDAYSTAALGKGTEISSSALAPTGTSVYSTGNISVPIPDLGTVEIPINVPDAGVVADINVRVRLNHTFDGDLDLALVSPSGATISLSADNGDSGDNYGAGTNNCSGTPTTFDDEAATIITAGAPPFAGSFRPEQPLSTFDGTNQNGTWRLRITDDEGDDVGTVGCVALEINSTGGGCTYSLTSDINNHQDPSASMVWWWQNLQGAVLTIRVNTQPGCAWSATNNNPSMLVITSGGGLTFGTGEFAYRPNANSGAFRTGVITVNLQSIEEQTTVTNHQDSSTPCSQSGISFNQPVNGTLSSADCSYYGHYNEIYTFSGVAGQQISVFMDPSQFVPYFFLFDPSGAIRVEGFPPMSNYTLPSTGTYTLRAAAASQLPGGSNTGNFTLLVTSGNNPVPTISSLNPTESIAGSEVNLTITGTNFLQGAMVQFGSQMKTPSSVTNTTIQVSIPGVELETPGQREVKVINPPPGGGASNALPFTVIAQASCEPLPIGYGETINGTLDNNSCLVDQRRTDVYTFQGTANQRIVVSADSVAIAPFIQLVAANGFPLETASGQTNARIPADGSYLLGVSGTYMIRVASTSSLGAYTLSLSLQPQNCSYTVSPTSTDVLPSGGQGFFFDVLTGNGCPPVLASLGPNSGHIQIVSNSGGRVTFSVDSYSGSTDRTGTILVAGQTHTVRQFGTSAPANDAFAQATPLPTPPSGPCNSDGTCIIDGRNTGASPEPGEPAHAGNSPSRSVWYRWTAPPDGGRFTFTTSGSSFDTVLAVYRGTNVGGLTLVAQNDNTTDFDQTSKVNFIAVGGQEYMIAVDGRSGATGSIRLAFGPFRRLFRLYLQNFNGNPATVEPTSVTATRMDGTGAIQMAGRVSLGVWEFDLPDDGSDYVAAIAGPTGYTWSPATYIINNSSTELNELMENVSSGTGTGGPNFISNSIYQTTRRYRGYIHGISTPTGMGNLTVNIASAGGNSAVPPQGCGKALQGGGPGGAMRVHYDCSVQPSTTHQIIPSMSGKAFVDRVKSIGVVNSSVSATTEDAIIASNATTANIRGSVTANGQPLALADLVLLTAENYTVHAMSGTDGAYTFANLPPGISYTITAKKSGFVFQPRSVVLQAPEATGIDFAHQGCTFTLSPESLNVGPGSGQGTFVVTASSATCVWTAALGSNSNWITIGNFGSTEGNGSVQFTVPQNNGPARTGTINVGNRTFTVTQAQGGTPTPTPRALFDYDGDRRADLSVWRPSDRFWYLQFSTGGFTGFQWGIAGDRIAPADFDGDGETDMAVFRPSDGMWYVVMSSGGFQSYPWGVSGDLPVPADHNGDGRADLVVYRPSNNTFYMMNPVNGVQFGEVQFGIAGDRPVVGDFDNDGRGNVAVFRPSNNTWYVRNLSGGYTEQQFGEAGDILVPADYDGDGKTDPAVFRPSTGIWYRTRSLGGGYDAVSWGQVGDIAVPADYDGDGKTDCAVFRPTEGVWYLYRSTAGLIGIPFGQNGDVPTPGAFVY